MSNVGLSCLHWGWGVINVPCKVVLLEEICQISQKPVRRSKWPCETSVVPIWGKCKQVIFLAKVHRFPLNLWQAGSQIKCVSDCACLKSDCPEKVDARFLKNCSSIWETREKQKTKQKPQN